MATPPDQINMDKDIDSDNFLSEVKSEHDEKAADDAVKKARGDLLGLIDNTRNVGDLISMDYNTAEVLIHDRLRQDVGGVPHGCLLLTTRISSDDTSLDLNDPKSSIILLRALRSSQLPNDIEMKRARLEAGQRAAQTRENWDDPGKTDQFTLDQMRYAGAHCRILGTFRMSLGENSDTDKRSWNLVYGGDIENFYAGQGMKVYKPAGEVLERIVNYSCRRSANARLVQIGKIRYAAAIHTSEAAESVPVKISAEDIIAQRTALFGMTRTGKSNTTKTIVSAVFRLRENGGQRVGQLILDPNGEYANENPQDQGCIKNVKNIAAPQFENDVVTYGLNPHPNDKDRKITKFNFYGNNISRRDMSKRKLDESLHSLYQGKQIINEALREETGGYVKDFIHVDIEAPVDLKDDYGQITRYLRRLFVYKSILAAAGFKQPNEQTIADIKGLFGKDIRKVMSDSDRMKGYAEAMSCDTISWDEAIHFCRDFSGWVTDKQSKFIEFDKEKKWSDISFLGMLRIFENTRGMAVIRDARQWHDTSSNTDYVEDIVKHIREGKLVIIDQALGNPDMNKQAANRIMERIFRSQQNAFIAPQITDEQEFKKPPPVIVYIEEAHTLLPKGNDIDTTNIWARIAKEGAKFNIGLAYSTQEPSTIQSNILKNTENWFIAHLNNTDETKELKKYNDFGDFTDSIVKVNETGFLRVRTLSSPYTLPVQIDKFTAPTED